MDLPAIHLYQVVIALVVTAAITGIMLFMLPYVRSELAAERAVEERAVLSAVWILAASQERCTVTEIYRCLVSLRGPGNRLTLMDVMGHLRSLASKGELVETIGPRDPPTAGAVERSFYALPKRES